MNKLFILLLAVCLVSVNAFVKRDAPEGASEFQKIQDQIQGMAKDIGAKLSDIFKPDQLKKTVDDLVDSFKSYTDKKPEAPKQ